jgi:hypothetical protein
LALAGGTVAGVVLGGTLAFLGQPTVEDHALVLAAAGNGMLLTALIVFAAVPVGFEQVGGALRTDFGLGVTGLGASVLGAGGAVAGLFLDVPVRRVAAFTAGGLLGGGLLVGAAFLLIPSDIDVKSRIAAGIGVGGYVAGAVGAALLLPDSLFGDAPAGGAAISLDWSDGDAAPVVRIGMPAIAPLVSAPVWSAGAAGGAAASSPVAGGPAATGVVGRLLTAQF